LKHVEFVSYDGKFPCLCHGTLHLKINGKSYFFGTNKPNIKFWSTGGGCGFDEDQSESYVTEGKWEIDVNDLPDELKQYASEISEVFNDNVEYGCCGGCI